MSMRTRKAEKRCNALSTALHTTTYSRRGLLADQGCCCRDGGNRLLDCSCCSGCCCDGCCDIAETAITTSVTILIKFMTVGWESRIKRREVIWDRMKRLRVPTHKCFQVPLVRPPPGLLSHAATEADLLQHLRQKRKNEKAVLARSVLDYSSIVWEMGSTCRVKRRHYTILSPCSNQYCV